MHFLDLDKLSFRPTHCKISEAQQYQQAPQQYLYKISAVRKSPQHRTNGVFSHTRDCKNALGHHFIRLHRRLHLLPQKFRDHSQPRHTNPDRHCTIQKDQCPRGFSSQKHIRANYQPHQRRCKQHRSHNLQHHLNITGAQRVSLSYLNPLKRQIRPAAQTPSRQMQSINAVLSAM